ncbi:hypothetical protein P8C59_000513 [Phyllachora maydis]|uniref:Histone transcription regulator 3 homolog n=1 Tax=Phyllachora maydis TaxID=1825666 RepID=A0AAD9MAF3_9PEZI|nr:hypothetical protein P8C59_000513 [Phyllachora maydis]
MPAFLAINVEPEESFQDEVDTAKAIQVDEALKLFQTALKLHAQGPQFFDDAADTYNALFETEIFKFPESTTEYERAEKQRSGTLAVELTLVSGLDAGAGDEDGIANTLPQALYLSQKNYGQFILDRIKHKARAAGPGPAREAVFEQQEVLDDARRALDKYAAALDWDPSDAELWRKTARVAAFLRSTRLSRYSLEAAIELDDDPAVVDVEPPSLAEGFAGIQLRNRLKVLGDDVAMTHPIMNTYRDRELPALLKRHLDPTPFLPDPTENLAPGKMPKDELRLPRAVLDVPAFSWSALGTALVHFITEVGQSGQALHLQLPEALEDDVDHVQMELDQQIEAPDVHPQAAEEPAEVRLEDAEGRKFRDNASESKDLLVTNGDAAATQDSAAKDQAGTPATRKRSQSKAGFRDPGDEENGDHKRSKRTRRRDTAGEEVMDPSTRLATQLQPYQAADQNLFQMTKDILENLGVTDKGTLDRIAEILDSCASEDRVSRVGNLSTNDLRNVIVNFDEELAEAFLDKKEKPELGLTTLIEHTMSSSQRSHQVPAFDEGQDLRQFVQVINSGCFTIHDIGFEYVIALVQSYANTKWSDAMKRAMVQVISRLDETLYDRTLYEVDGLRCRHSDEQLARLVSLVEMVFELHLDIYERITNPNSAVEYKTRVQTKWRLSRWADLAADLVRELPRETENEPAFIRFLWTSVLFTTLGDAVSQEHVIACWASLRDCLASAEVADISLPNNAAMPDLCAAAADREISKLTTMKFFLGLFREDLSDPVSVIETLEPVLNPESVFVKSSLDEDEDEDEDGYEDGDGDGDEDDDDGMNSKESSELDAENARQSIRDCASQGLRDLWKFLEDGTTELRLFLWTRLSGAYGKIKYTTKQFSCLLRSIEMIIMDLEKESYKNTAEKSRRSLLMDMLASLDDVLVAALQLALSDNDSFDIIDEEHLKSSSSALAKLNCLLHAAAMFEDEVRVGMAPTPASGATWTSFINKLREMQVRAWCLQYMVIKVGIYQHKSMFSRPENDLADYLAAVHQVLGLRKSCKVSLKIFLKMMRVELLKQKNIENWEDYLGQVLYDLYGLRLGVGIWEVQDHGCQAETLERKQAIQLVDKIMLLATRMSMKDLLKSDLKSTIEHIQQAIGSPRSTSHMIHNLRNFTEYLKKPIHPLRLYQALQGKVTLDVVTVNTSEGALAKQGWFFLLGMIALTRFKGVDLNRRQTPGATDDLRLGATYLRLQLQFTPDRWEAWFRLAECFDYELDEAVLWTADKMNKERAELVKFQRNSIHCYTLALSNAHSAGGEPLSVDEQEVLYDLYQSFGMRLYASSREPFAMEPFQHADQQRFFIESMGAGTFKKIVHDEMTTYKVWKYAANLFGRAVKGRPKDWKNSYMLSKCLWKMYQTPLETLDAKDRETRPTVEQVVAALEKTILISTALPKPRHGQDPILEPHYKMLSVAHKLVMRGDFPAQEAAAIIERQPYTPQPGGTLPIQDKSDWEGFAVKCLRALRDKDKSNWQHRMIIRHARILLDPDDRPAPGGSSQPSGDGEFGETGDTGEESASYVAAKAASMVLRESMFTKTMVMNVWKCDAERPGRHHVYTEQYVRLMVQLLAHLRDRELMEAVLRRIRKKGADFYHFADLWQFCIHTYLRLLRRVHRVPSNYATAAAAAAATAEATPNVPATATAEDFFKGLSPDEFDIVAERINTWAAGPAAASHPGMAALREAVELKKLNAGLLKAAPIDDLIADCYAFIYTDLRAELPGPPPAEVVEARHRLKEMEQQQAANEAAAAAIALNRQQEREATTLGSLRASPERGAVGEKMEKTISSIGVGAVVGEPGPRGRKLGIRRPDILRKAEQAVLRAAEGPPKAVGPGAGGHKSRVGSASSGKHGDGTPHLESDAEEDDDGAGRLAAGAGARGGAAAAALVEDGPNDGEEEDEDEDEDEDVDMKDVGTEDGEGGPAGGAKQRGAAGSGAVRSEASSPPGSVHDSADDESELSDVPPDYDEEVPPELLFPNLRRSVDAAREAGDSAGNTSSALSENEEEGEEEEEEEEERGVEGDGAEHEGPEAGEEAGAEIEEEIGEEVAGGIELGEEGEEEMADEDGDFDEKQNVGPQGAKLEYAGKELDEDSML